MNSENEKSKSEEQKLSYYQRNKAKCIAQATEYRLKNKEKYQEYWKKYYQENKAELTAKRVAYARKHKERIYKKNREKYYPKHQAKKKEEMSLKEIHKARLELPRPEVLEKIVSEPAFTFTRTEGDYQIRWD
jgi:hypothetical protein